MTRVAELLNQFFIIACFQGFLLAAALLFMKKGDKILNRIFGILLLTFSWSGIYYTIDIMGKSGDYPTIAYTNFLSDYAYNPLIYLYVLRLTIPNFRITKKMLLHFVPVVFMFIYYANYYFAPVSDKLEIMHRGYNYFPWDVAWFSYINLLQLLIYLVLATLALQKYGRKIKMYYSEIAKRNFEWLKWILVYNFFGSILCFFLYNSDLVVFDRLIATSASILIYVIGYKMVSSPPHIPEFEIQKIGPPNTSADSSAVKYEKSGLTEDRSAYLAENLRKIMADQRPWLDPELTLKELADKLNIPPHQLSQLINQKIGKNFYDYINEFRVGEVKSKLADPKFDHLTLLAIGLDSGFNSKASFNNVFKKFTGKSPSEYKKEINVNLQIS